MTTPRFHRPARLPSRVLVGAAWLWLAALAWPADLGAQPATSAIVELPDSASPSNLGADAGILFGLPAALGTGQTTGLGLGVTSRGSLAWGARASWSQATEYTQLWAVTHSEVRLRATLSAHKQAGRGLWLVRLGLGGTVVRESRVRDQSARLSTSGTALTTSAWALLPGVDLEVGTWLRLAGDWGVAVTGGPCLHLQGGAVQTGWLAQLGVAWLP